MAASGGSVRSRSDPLAAAWQSGDAPPPASTPRRRRLVRALIGSGAVGLVTAAGVLGVAAATGRSPADLLGLRNAAVATVKAVKTRLRMVVAARGELESAKGARVASQVEGQTTILWIKPEGTWVRKGELVCELDSAALRNSRIQQRLVVQQAQAALESAVNTLGVTEVELREYVGGMYPQTVQSARHAVGLAESQLEQAASQFDWSRNMLRKGLVAPSHTTAARFTKENRELTVLEAKTRVHVIEQYTRKKTFATLEGEVAKARIDEMAKRAVYQTEKSKLDKLEAQIARCQITAPGDGLMVYVNAGSSGARGPQPKIEEGAVVRERQFIFSLPDLAQMRVNAKVDEAEINRVGPGQNVRIHVDAFPNLPLEGTVDSLRPLADPRAREDTTEVRLYTVLIPIERAPSSLRPGMSVRTEITVGQSDDVVAIPVRSVLTIQGTPFVFVVTPEGPKLRNVELGMTDDKLIAVERGLHEGEDVAREPMAVLTERQRRAAFDVRSDRRDEYWFNARGTRTSASTH